MTNIVEKNLEKMIGSDETDMPRVLMTESIGGNAGQWNGLPCVAANMFVDYNTGEIIAFGNPQYLPKEYWDDYSQATFVLAIDWGQSWKDRIIEFHSRGDIDSAVAMPNIEESIRKYNEKYGFEIPAHKTE